MQFRERKLDDASVQDHLHRFRRDLSLAPTTIAGIKPSPSDIRMKEIENSTRSES